MMPMRNLCILMFGLVHITNKVKCGDLWADEIKRDDEYDDKNEDLSYVNHPCKRICTPGKTMTCHYQFRAEHFFTLSKACYNCFNTTSDCFRKDCIVTDGVARAVITINRMIPGPTIHVCFGDKIIIDLVNRMPDQVITIHWHGHRQMVSPFMDGVPYVTQCPVLPFTTFRYTMYATNCGTHWWHSHVGTQREDGAFGAFIVKLPNKTEPMKKYYDYDHHAIIVSDWSDKMSTDAHLNDILGPTLDVAQSLLVNGLGPRWANGSATTTSPIHQINVTKGHCYRIRFIHAGSRLCPTEVYIDEHSFLVMATDGENIKPVKAESFFITNGERYDIVVCANKSVDNYWIRFTGYGACGVNSVHQVCILHYEGAKDAVPMAAVGYANHEINGITVNPYNQNDSASNTVSINDLCGEHDPCKNYQENDPSLNDKVQSQHIVEIDFKPVNHSHYHHIPYTYLNVNSTYQHLTPEFDNTSYMSPSSNLFSQWDQIDKDIFCANRDQSRCNGTNFCNCIKIIKIPLYSSTEIVFIDLGSISQFNTSHPIHVHGYSYHVVSLQRASKMNKAIFKELDKAGKVKRHLRGGPCPPARKDVMSVPSPGYSVIRFYADNPGLWFVHCHVEPHIEVGMAMVVQVGEPHQWRKVPPGFPTCGDFKTNYGKEDYITADNSFKQRFLNVLRFIFG